VHFQEVRDAVRAVPPPSATTVSYYHLDALGSVRAVTDAQGAVVRLHDYLPFGEEYQGVPGGDARRFTGKERDAETGLDYFSARYYAQARGRFLSVDPVLDVDEALTDPQRWNRYAYVRNSPLAYIDPDGRNPVRALITLISESPALQRAIVEAAKRFSPQIAEGVGRFIAGGDQPGTMGMITVQDIARKIGTGHAFDRHVEGRADLAHLATTRDELSALAADVMHGAKGQNVKMYGFKAAYYDPARQVVVIVDFSHPDLGTVFRATKEYFDGLDKEPKR
jgi:RHS repeat-associated protein